MTVGAVVSIIPSKLPTNLITLPLTISSRLSWSSNCIPLTITMFYEMPITVPTGLRPQIKYNIYKMRMEHTRLMPSTGAAMLSLIKLLPLDALLLLGTVFFITCIVERENLKPCLLKPFTFASREWYVQLNSWTVVMKKNLKMTKPISFFYSFSKEHIQDYVYHGNCVFKQDSLEDLKNIFQGHYDASPPKNWTNKTITIMTKANPIVAPMSHIPKK